MDKSIAKSRTPSRCREWERNRRNKFNDAMARLGAVVKTINKAIDATGKDSDLGQYPKIEIVEKAIVCLSNLANEKTQLKAEILALQVRLEGVEKQSHEKKDASTQVFIGINKKKPNGKYVKVLMLQKSKRNALKEKCILSTNITVESKVEKPCVKMATQNAHPQTLPMLLPKTNGKKGSENTIMVLPAAPYIFPQRPLLFPTVPPAFVLLDSNLQTLNKPPFPLSNRNNGDVTKTTMVNILPISAYSRPLSVTKSKKISLKSKTDIVKKPKKLSKTTKAVKESKVNTLKAKNIGTVEEHKEKEPSCDINKENSHLEDICETEKDLKVNLEKENAQVKNTEETIHNSKISNETNFTEHPKTKTKEIPKITTDDQFTETGTVEKDAISSSLSNTVQKPNTHIVNIEHLDGSDKSNKNSGKSPEDSKENKLTNILDTSLCETAVDGGNARLELAEEFLAASPTAAFLMSFPLVSGNRADSPAEEPQSTLLSSKDNDQRRNVIATQSTTYFEKSNENKAKSAGKPHNTHTNSLNKQSEQHKYLDVASKNIEAKTTNITLPTNVSSDNPFLNLPMPSFIPTSCTIADSTYGLDFDCNLSKTVPSQSSSYVSSNNLFYKSDPFSTVKSTIYSTSSISSGHEFNSFGLYPCAMEKFTTKTKSDYPNVEDNLMKIGSSRLTYDIDLGWSHKSLDFVSCSSSTNTFNKDNIMTTAAGPYSTPYNPFNPEFHVPLASNSSKKENSSSKPTSSFAETLTSFYSQPTNLWSEDVPFYTNTNISKTLTSKHQNYLALDHIQTNQKSNISKQYETKHVPEIGVDNAIKSSNLVVSQPISDKYTKKSPNKMHINWMTSEIRPLQNVGNPSHTTELKESHKPTYNNQLEHNTKKHDHNESNNYFPISMHMQNFPPQATQEELHVWPSARPAGTTEISIEPPPINLPTLVGDLALGPHDKKKSVDVSNRVVAHSDLQNCGNFLSVTQLMNRSTDNMPSRYPGPHIEIPKSTQVKQNITNSTNDTSRKTLSRLENHITQPCYVFNDPKPTNSYEVMGHFSQPKAKLNKPDKISKTQKNSYSAEALIRGGTGTQKLQDNTKFMAHPQKYNNFNAPQSSVAQVSHFPPILDYSESSYPGQQFSGTTLYNSTTNTMSNSFYSNFMPGSGNLMSGNYTTGPFSGDFMDYNQSTDCNYSNNKFEELKLRNNPTMFQQEKSPSNYKSSRRESAAKHKLECSKKDSSKKYQNKRAKTNADIEEWTDTSHLLWQNKTPSKRHSNILSEDLPFPNYVGNQMSASAQYQPDFFNSHLLSSNVQTVGHNIDRSLTSFPATSRANFNLSTIFPEITMKVQ